MLLSRQAWGPWENGWLERMPGNNAFRQIGARTLGPGDFRDPVGFLSADHARIRTCCDHLVRLADAPVTADGIAAATTILDFLENDLPRHVVDEEQDLFPLLEQRALQTDRIGPVVALLRSDHRDDVEFGHVLLEPLHAISAGRPPADAGWFRTYVHAFRTLQRRHHALEDQFVMPLAAERLTAADKEGLGRKMAARRGVTMPD